MKLIVGLGNPGKQYEKTRHNAGFIVVDNFVEYNKIGNFSNNDKYKAELITCEFNNNKVIFLKPMTFMNKSGYSVSKIVDFFKIKIDDILVIHDEIDLDMGVVKLKKGGGHAGHNGLRNIIDSLGSGDFFRLRVGVSRPLSKEQVVDYVLSNFSKTDFDTIMGKESDIFEIINNFLVEKAL